MKKVYVLFAILMMFVIAQSAFCVTASSNSDSTRPITKIGGVINTPPITPTPTPTQTYVWSQPNDVSGRGVISVHYTDQSNGKYSADDFQVAEPIRIDTIFVEGFFVPQSTVPLYYFWYIYPNQNGNPAGYPGDGNGKEVWSYCCKPDAPEVTVETYSVTLDLNIGPVPPLNLERGRYWLCFFAANLSGNNSYILTSGSENLNPAHIIEPTVSQEKGATLWQSWPERFGITYYDAAFRLDGGVVEPESYKKWSQPPTRNPSSAYPECYYGWNEHSFYTEGPVVADDFLCSDTRPITDVHWWGSYEGWLADVSPPQELAPVMFHVGLWTDVPISKNGVFSHPGEMIKEWVVSLGDLSEEAVGCDYYPEYTSETCFLYNFNIPEGDWFSQDEGPNIYWVSIAAMYDTLPEILRWGWKTRDHFFNDEAVIITAPVNPGTGYTYETGMPMSLAYQRGPWDMAFEITTNVPPPTPTPTATPTATASPTPTGTPTPTPTPTLTFTPTPTPTITFTPTPTPTSTTTPTPTATATGTAIPTPTPRPTGSPTPTPTSSPTVTPTFTPTPTGTATPTPTTTGTATFTPTPTPSPTKTPTPEMQSIIDYLLGRNPTPTPTDVNDDGYIDIADLIALMQE